MEDSGTLSSDTLGMNIGPPEPGSQTGMETTISADATRDGECPPNQRPLDLSFLEPSSRAGSIGKVGDYEIIGVQGWGAMGIVLKGLDRELDRFVAVKVQDPSLALNRRARARFLHEARSVATISDPHVVTIYKVNAVKDRPYLAMEFVETSLRERVKAHAPLPLIEVLRIGEQVALGLAAAHARGILHRDIKPANILIDGEGRTKISDFGLAIAGEDGLPWACASPDHVAGTPGYMSPEQVRGEQLDARSDLFSLGCVIHAMFTARSPFAREFPSEVFAAILESEPAPTPVADGCPISEDLKALVARLLSKDPAGRPDSAYQVAAELAALKARAQGSPAPAPLAIHLDHAPNIPIPAGRNWLAIASYAAALAAAVVAIAVLVPRLNRDAGKGKLAAKEATPSEARPPRETPRHAEAPTLLVGRGAEFPDLAWALAKATPGARIVLTTPDVQQGPFILDDAARFRDVTIEARAGATLAASVGESVVAIRNVPGVTLRGLKIDAHKDQFAVTIAGDAEGVTLDRLGLRSPKESRWTQVYIRDRATGTEARPILVAGCRFDVGQGGVTIEGEESGSVGHVDIRGNRFFGPDEQVHVLRKVHDVEITGNVFVKGQSLTLNLARWDGNSLLVANNTFFQSETWLHPADSDPNQEGVVICNNAILESNDIDAGNRDLSRMARGKWAFRNNLWEPGPEAIAPSEGPLVESRPRLEVMSRDPARKDFLRPTPDSALARSGAGGTYPRYVGALAPSIEEAQGRKASGPR